MNEAGFVAIAAAAVLGTGAVSLIVLGSVLAVLDYVDRQSTPNHLHVFAPGGAYPAPRCVDAHPEMPSLGNPPCDFGVVDGSPLMAPFLGGLPRQAPNGVTALSRYRRISSDDETSDSVAAEMVPTSPSDLGCVQLFAPLQGCLR